MKLTLVEAGPYFYDGSDHYTRKHFVRSVKAFAPYFEEITICGPLMEVDRPPAHSFPVEVPNLSFCKLPYSDGIADFIKKFPKNATPLIRAISENIHNWDLVWIRLPNPAGFIAYKIARKHGKPILLQMSGDQKKIVRAKYSGMKRLIAYLGATFFTALDKKMIKETPTLVLSSELLRKFRNYGDHLFYWLNSQVSQDDIYYREDTCLGESIHILYVGSLEKHKGLDYLMIAERKLRDAGYNVHLNLVGTGSQGSILKELTMNLSIHEYVIFHGYIGDHAQLLRVYRKNDIFILPSLSEGMPKVLFEAMASGLPIVAADVGGIPDVIKPGETGLLVPPRSPDGIYKAVEKLITDDELRKKIIQEGYAFVEQHTIEKQAERIMAIIKQHVIGHR